MPIILGTNRDEGSTFTANQTGHGDHVRTPTSMYDNWLYDSAFSAEVNGGSKDSVLANKSQFIAWASNMFGARAAATLAVVYQPQTATNDTTPGNDARVTTWWWAVSHVIGDYILSCPARRAARQLTALGHKVFVYYFNHTPATSINAFDTYLTGAFHGAEVPFVFYDEFELATTEERNLSIAMTTYWRNFAYTGDPNNGTLSNDATTTGPNGTAVHWPVYARSTDSYLLLGDTMGTVNSSCSGCTPLYLNVTTVTNLKATRCDWWDMYAAFIEANGPYPTWHS